ncbi:MULTISPECIES: serine hydrolase domain-containing protein [unclassified Sphingomonas]|uniref:serine hydrolase domain-containing protein n=1 Tax=unclassified Sphingomonas TaxID=196159 RepID=UPI00092BFAB4|nr:MULTISPECIES: serine hydrolase domain-containing protein [unclassified Sphingomonas]MBN8849003.1 beta-lactamase family protein [Sphingomonas sp.]OJV31736.1 MAG: penicillin-binding protein [Sphingomonas sp. 67-36]
MIRKTAAALIVLAVATAAAAPPQVVAPVPAAETPQTVEAMAPQLTAYFDTWMKDAHVPGLVFGVVKDGRLVLVRGLGVQDPATGAPVTADSSFRIASMSKAFTALAILKLRDAGKLSLDAPAERYVPEMANWRYPTRDSPRITVADLLHHVAGFVEDNPWGDRQQPLPEADFTALLKAGVAFARAPELKMEYSNLGYATLGRIVSNVSGMPYERYIRREIMAPLGMKSTGYDVAGLPQGKRALGYRWREDAAGKWGWVREPDMADGAFGAMGGVQTSANDYWRWVAFLLSAWPARDDADNGPIKRGTVRQIVEGANFVETSERAAALGAPCRQSRAYGKGWFVVSDCDLGRVATHTGGYPGYGSVVALLPEAGVGVFAFANRTYGAPSLPAFQALIALRAAGLAADRPIPVSPGLADAYRAAKASWQSGDPASAPLAMNVPLDRDLARRRADLAALKAKVGGCAMSEPIVPTSAMEGTFAWNCATGKVAGRVQRAPTPALSLQVLDFKPAP